MLPNRHRYVECQPKYSCLKLGLAVFAAAEGVGATLAGAHGIRMHIYIYIICTCICIYLDPNHTYYSLEPCWEEPGPSILALCVFVQGPWTGGQGMSESC